MPTENRSSNTELRKIVTEALVGMVSGVTGMKPPADEPLPGFIQAPIDRAVTRISGLLALPAPQPHPEPIAWMVGTAIWWTKEEAERDAVATGKTITPIGPMSGIAPAEEHQGDPVAWRGINELGEVVTDWVDGVPPASMLDLCGNPASFAKIEQAYTHADPGEVERLSRKAANADLALAARTRQVHALRAQLAERVSLLREVLEFIDDGVGRSDAEWRLIQKVRAVLSASAEPSACEHDWVDARNEHVLSGELCAKCHAIRAGNSAAEPSVPVEHDERSEFEACFDRTLKEQEAGLEHYQVSTMRFGKEVMWEGWKARAALERKSQVKS